MHMPDVLVVKDRVAARAPVESLRLPWTFGIAVTLRQLIAERVRLEMETRHDSLLAARGPRQSVAASVQPGEADIAAATAAAFASFARNGFFVVIDGAQVFDLDVEIPLTPASDVVFVRLTQLVGG